MIGNIIRLAELLQKESLTRDERREGINLTQSMFGTTAYAHRDHTLVALRRKQGNQPNDPTGAVARAAAASTVIGVNTNSGQLAADADAQHAIIAGTFRLGDDLYEAHKDKAGRDYYTKNGNRIKNADYATALAEAEGAASDES